MTRKEMIDALEELKTKNIVEGSEDSERIDYVLNNTLDSLELWKLPVKDAISREEVIRICELSASVVEIQDRIENLPPVYPKAKVGKWIGKRITNSFYGKCSECKQEFCMDAWYSSNMNYCPNCGAKMEGVQE